VKCWKSSQGQSLVEVLVAVGAMSLLLVSLLSLISLSVRNSRLAKDRTQALSLAQGGIELMRAYRDYSWTDFSGSAGGTKYDLPGAWVVEDGLSTACNESTYTINNVYRRCVEIQGIDAQEMSINVEVSWQEGNQVHQAIQETRLSVWQR